MREEQVPREWHSRAKRCTCPLYIGAEFLADGHTERDVNATATFVQRKGRHYAITCGHVVRHVQSAARRAFARIHLGRSVVELKHVLADGRTVSALREVLASGLQEVDIAIAPLTDLWWLCERNDKAAIDLDRWTAPPWDDVRQCAVAGYPTEHKSTRGEYVVAPMPLIVCDVASKLHGEAPTFTAHSRLAQPHGWTFSGMSGGPAYAIGGDPDNLIPIGLVYEGHPSSDRIGPSSAEAFLDSQDILVRLVALNPERLDQWLESLAPLGP